MSADFDSSLTVLQLWELVLKTTPFGLYKPLNFFL